MGIAAALLPGVVVRADTPARVDLQLVRVATRHGWVNDYDNDAALASAALADTAPPPELEERLKRASREAFDWLESNAVLEGWVLVESDGLVVLDRAA